jgi:hypothetical protein
LLYNRFIGHFPLTAIEAVGDAALLALPRFAVVRDPWERLASAYRFAAGGGGEGKLGALPATHIVRAVSDAGSFERFVKDWLSQRDINIVDGLFRPQSYYLRSAAAHLEFDHLGRIEDLHQTELWLGERLGCAITLPHSNAASGQISPVRYDAEMIDIVARIYAADIALLGY